MQVFGITGTAGSGKDTVADIIQRLYGIENISTSEFVRTVARHVYGHPHNYNPVRAELYAVANFMRKEFNPEAIVRASIFQAQERGIQRPLISGLRTMGEAKAIHAASGIVIAVDADPRLRYERINHRKRDYEAIKSYEQFIEQDSYENKGTDTQGDGRGIHYIIEHADVLIVNNGSREELEKQIKTKLDPLLK